MVKYRSLQVVTGGCYNIQQVNYCDHNLLFHLVVLLKNVYKCFQATSLTKDVLNYNTNKITEILVQLVLMLFNIFFGVTKCWDHFETWRLWPVKSESFIVFKECTSIWTVLTHRGRVMHICVSKISQHWFKNGLSPARLQAILWTNADSLSMRPLGSKFSEIRIEIQNNTSQENEFENVVCKMVSVVCWPRPTNVIRV